VSVQVDFFLLDAVFQATGVDIAWEITWPGVIDSTHFAGVSFFDIQGTSRLVRVSESFSTDLPGTQHVTEVVRGSATGVGFVAPRFAIVVAPAH